LKRYLDQLNGFDGDRTEFAGQIEHKSLRLAIPEGATDEQIKEIIYAMGYAGELGIDMEWFVAQ
jgi:hypothetical protein